MPNMRHPISAVLVVCLIAAGAGLLVANDCPSPTAAAREASSLDAVLIGYFGPSDPLHPGAGDMWRAASMAVEQANEAGGYEGIPFQLVPAWSQSPWAAGVTDVVRLAFVHRVWAMVGGVDGPSTHLAEQVVAKARLALVNPVATDKTVNLAPIPWVFSCAPPDDAQARVLARAIAADARTRPFVIVSATDHDSHLFTVELLKALGTCKLTPAYHFQFDPGERTHREVMERAKRVDPNAVVLIAQADAGAQCLRHLRDRGCKASVFGGPWMGSRAFLEQAGKAAEGVVFPNLLASSATWSSFEQAFTKRFGRSPDYLVAHAYDATAITITAVRRGGLDRAGIIAALKEIAPWQGVGGEIRWNSFGANSRPVSLGIVRDGRILPFDPPEPR